MHEYANARLVADRQGRYLREAEQHRLAKGGEPRARRAHGIMTFIGSAASTVGAFGRRPRAGALAQVAPTS